MQKPGSKPVLCKTCPFIPGNEREGWEPNARAGLLALAESFNEFMECHSKEQTHCSGYLRTIGRESIAVRLAVHMGTLDARELRPIPGGVTSFEELDRKCQGAKNWEEAGHE